MCIPQPIIPVHTPPQPVTGIRSGSADALKVLYIRCLNGQVPKAFEVWALAEYGVREVHPYTRVKFLSEFRKDTFQTLLFNARRFQIPFLGRRALNMSVEFPDVVRVTQHVGSCVEYTPNICVHSWGVNPTDTIPPNVYTITRPAHDHIRTFHGFILQSNHKRLILKRFELKRIRFEELLARIRGDVRDDVLNNDCYPVNRALGDASSNDSYYNDG